MKEGRASAGPAPAEDSGSGDEVAFAEGAGRWSRAPLSPVSFLLRSAEVWRESTAVQYEGAAMTYAELLDRVARVAGALGELGALPGDRVAVMLPNVPAMLELHYAVPGSGKVLVPMNTRLGVAETAWILDHSGARCLVAFAELEPVVAQALSRLSDPPECVYTGGDGDDDFEALVEAAPAVELVVPKDEFAPLGINYTSGTTGIPRGAVYTHRGAYQQALGVAIESGLRCSDGYLWTLPMFHCNGWAFTWAVTAAGARNICLRSFEPAAVWRLLRRGAVTHLCGAPTVMTMLAHSEDAAPLVPRVRAFVGGAPPAPALIGRMGELGIDMTHLYGLTETYGPVAVCAWKPEWDALPSERQARLAARQGVGTVVSGRLRVVDEELRDTPADGVTLGEVVMRGNNVTPGYYRDPEATARAFAGGWFHSGDLAVMHEDGYIELRDRAKDIIISGGENISTIEIEQRLVEHQAVAEVAVIGVPDERWGERPKAFVVVRDGVEAPTVEALQEFVRETLARFKVPGEIAFCSELPKTATGKIQKHRLRDAPGGLMSGGRSQSELRRSSGPVVSLAERAVVVTGAGSGLGRAYALELARHGAMVLVNDVDADLARETANEIRAAGGTTCAYAGSVAEWDRAAALVSRCVEEFGALDVLVNNAGVMHVAAPWDETERDLRRVVEVNLLGTMFCGTHALRVMRGQGGGAIINVTSGALLGISGIAAYGATKGAVASLTHAWAIEGRDCGIRVNAISPLANTHILDPWGEEEARRRSVGASLGSPQAIAPLVVALASEACTGVTGQVIRFDGRTLSVLPRPRFEPLSVERDDWNPDAIAALLGSRAEAGSM